MSVNQEQPSNDPIYNEYSITVATVNGSGSQTSNTTIMRALFRMGIPVSGKNLFPSNIQGLPTWYTIRLSEAGFLARREEQEIVVAMNPETFEGDQRSVVSGGVLIYDDSIKLPVTREDITSYPMPVKQIVRESGAASNLRDYIANMVYVGTLAHLLDIEMDYIYQALDYHFKGKQKAVDLNWNVVKASAKWAANNLEKKDPYHVRMTNKTEGHILADGNTAAALGSIYGGVQFCGWYPITPATSLAESLVEYLPLFRMDPVTGKNTCAVVQAEDELAAVGMIIGAGWAGLRAMTSTSGPGISLMTEYVGLAYYAEVPIVIWDVQRVGPSTGLPTRTSQGDLIQVYYAGHGDTQHIVLLPGSVTECFEFGWKSFDLAERFQTPVFVLSDLDFGMNQWMSAPFEYPDQPMDRGKVIWEEDLDRLNGEWGRYLDVDGDGIPYRTLPGNRHPAASYFARGTGHNEYAQYSEEAEVWERVMARLRSKLETVRAFIPEPQIKAVDGADISIIAYGSTDPAIHEAIYLLEKHGIKVDYMRVKALPVSYKVEQFIRAHKRNYVVELNQDGQLHQILVSEIPGCAMKLVSLSHLDGLPLTADWVVKAIITKEEEND